MIQSSFFSFPEMNWNSSIAASKPKRKWYTIWVPCPGSLGFFSLSPLYRLFFGLPLLPSSLSFLVFSVLILSSPPPLPPWTPGQFHGAYVVSAVLLVNLPWTQMDCRSLKLYTTFGALSTFVSFSSESIYTFFLDPQKSLWHTHTPRPPPAKRLRNTDLRLHRNHLSSGPNLTIDFSETLELKNFMWACQPQLPAL